MAPKRSAPPPPVESSVETDSGSATDESEEEISSPPSVTTKNTAPPPPQKIQQPEDSEEEEEEEGVEEEEEVKPNHSAPPSATQNPPPAPQQPKREEFESNEEEMDDEAPKPALAPKKEAEVEDKKPLLSSEEKKPAAHIQRSWSKDDEVRILEVLATLRRENGTLPQPEELEAALAGSLDNSDYGRNELMRKVKTLKTLYDRAVEKGGQKIKGRDLRFFHLCKQVWGGGDMPANGAAPRDFDEMCQMYPFLGGEVKVLDTEHSGLFKRAFCLIEDEKARAMDQKLKKLKVLEMKLGMRRLDMENAVTKALIALVQ